MKIRPCAEFRADFPDDQIWDDDNNVVQFGGRNIAEALGTILQGQGYEVLSLEEHPEHGWDFVVGLNAGELLFEISFGGETWHLSTSGQSIDRWPKPSDYAELLIALDAEMRKDGRFSDIGWRRENWQGKNIAPTPHPVDA